MASETESETKTETKTAHRVEYINRERVITNRYFTAKSKAKRFYTNLVRHSKYMPRITGNFEDSYEEITIE